MGIQQRRLAASQQANRVGVQVQDEIVTAEPRIDLLAPRTGNAAAQQDIDERAVGAATIEGDAQSSSGARVRQSMLLEPIPQRVATDAEQACSG